MTGIQNTLSFVTLRNPSDRKTKNKMMNEMRALVAAEGPTGSFIYSVSKDLTISPAL